MKQILEIAIRRNLTLDDIPVERRRTECDVREFCNDLANYLSEQYLSGALDWQQADLVANNYFEIMIRHCGRLMPEYAWEVFLAFDDAEVDDQKDELTIPSLNEIRRKFKGGCG